ncbi:CBS domain-containing protein [Arenibaculum pallidiluteum]|uniref:CBS domain-containing protein n=1 Tax=Arenibaculum pallidiluteum TaxID=2812559 RepID=UPI001A971209|nr:CBS domain-containing protein [Arenibaculum pallidiluteum]
MRVADVMTMPVVTIFAGASVEDAVRRMIEHEISGLPVTDAHGRLVGVVTEGDFLRRIESGTERRRSRWLEFLLGSGRIADEYVQVRGRRVEDVMTRGAVTVDAQASLAEAVGLMERYRVKRLPVTREGELVGVISRANLVRALLTLAPTHAGSRLDDEVIRERIEAELRSQPWAPGASLHISVHDGIVVLRGVVIDERRRKALRVAAENVPGVRQVNDQLVWIEPNSGAVLDPSDGENGGPQGAP